MGVPQIELTIKKETLSRGDGGLQKKNAEEGQFEKLEIPKTSNPQIQANRNLENQETEIQKVRNPGN